MTNLTTNQMRALRVLLVAGMPVFTACQDLDVTNSNSPSVEEVLNSPTNLESAVGTSFRVFWGVSQGARTNSVYPVTQLAAMGEELTSTDLEVWEVSQEPRVAYNNLDAGQWTNRKPWYDLYEVIATNSDALKVLDGGLKVGPISAAYPNGRNTARARTFARMMIGLSHIYLGMMFDKAFVTDEKDTDDPFKKEFKPYKDVVAFGIAQLEQAIAIAQTSPNDTTPDTWVNGVRLTSPELVWIMNSFIARAMVYSARNPTERAAVDWTKVITYLDKGITGNSVFAMQGNSLITGASSSYIQRTQLMSNARADNRLVGPADTSGAYQAWLALPVDSRIDFQLRTPDRRVQGATGPTANGTIIGYLASQTMSTARGTYMFSRYRGIKYGTSYWNTGLLPTMSAREMEFIRAEALYRLGNRAGTVTILNRTRVPANLAPVTVDGPPPGAACVPRKDSGACGDLFDALMYEKRIELFGLEAIIPFADWRGWGRLLKGSMIHFPVPGRELQTLGLPVYSYGGNLPGSQP